jgi:hypothetical protein
MKRSDFAESQPALAGDAAAAASKLGWQAVVGEFTLAVVDVDEVCYVAMTKTTVPSTSRGGPLALNTSGRRRPRPASGRPSLSNSCWVDSPVRAGQPPEGAARGGRP